MLKVKTFFLVLFGTKEGLTIVGLIILALLAPLMIDWVI